MYLKNILFSEVKNLLGPPRQNYNFFPLNLFGLQIIRYVFAFFKYKLFNQTNFETAEANKLEKNGYVILNDFLPNDDFNEILETCKKIESENKFSIKNYGKKKVHSYNFFEVNPDSEKNIHNTKELFLRLLSEKKIYKDIFKILKIPEKSIQNLSYEKIVVDENFIDEGDEDAEFHADRFYPCIKIFFYLDDNKLENGAFEYIAKSHKFSFNRLVHEYLYSIFISGKTIFKRAFELVGYELKNNRVTFVSKKIEKLFGRKAIVACEAPKNSLVICNNKGFHRRGRLVENRSRTHLRINLYDLQISDFKNYLLNLARQIKKSKQTKAI